MSWYAIKGEKGGKPIKLSAVELEAVLNSARWDGQIEWSVSLVMP